MDLQLPEQIHSMEEAIAALMQQASKDALASYARAKCGAKFDDARTSKSTIAEMILRHHAQQKGQTIAPKDDDGMEAILAQAVKVGYLSETGAQNWAAQYDMATDEEHPVMLRDLRDAVAAHKAEQQPKDAPKAKEQPKAAPEQKNAQNVAQAIAAALATVKLGVDPEEIRAAVKEEVGAVADTLRAEIMQNVFRVEVKLPSGETRDVGRQHKQFPTLLKAVGAGCHVWLAGPAGSGKTTAAEAVANALNLPFSFDGAMDTEYKVVGFTDAQGRIVSTAFRRAYTEGGVHLFDECDASLAPATLAINAALANGYAAFPDGMAKKHPNFRCIAAANTWGLGATFDYVGRNKLDAAFLDRFVRLNWDYDEMLERDISGNPEWCTYVQTMRMRAKAKGLKVVISPRATLYGAQLLAAGMTKAEVIDLTLRNGMRPEDFASIQK
jgi:cobaltochelatase CobS